MSEDNSPIIIVGIGHSTLEENAQSQLLTNPELLALAKKDSGYNAKLNRITEYKYCLGLATMIVQELKSLGITGLTSNRYNGADINGESKTPRDMNAEIKAINKALPSLGNRVKAELNLHLNETPGGTGYEQYVSNNKNGIILGKFLGSAVTSVLGIRYRKTLTAGEAPGLPGMGFTRSVRVPSCLMELFFVDNNSDLKAGLEKKQELANAIALALKDYCDEKLPPLNISLETTEARVQSTALVEDKLKSTVSDEDIKIVALQTQEKLTPIESQFGEGGDHYTMATKNSIEIIGTVPPPMDPTLIDETGQVFTRPILRSGGITNQQKTFPSFQKVDITSDVPTGKKAFIVNTAFDVSSYEININSAAHSVFNAGGNLKLSSNYQTDFVSGYTLNFDAGSIFNVSAPDIVLNGPVTISGTMALNGGILSSGPIYSDSSINSPAFNGPAVIDKTNSQELYGYLAGILSMLISGGSVKLTGKIKTHPIDSGATEVEIIDGTLDIASGGILQINGVNSGLGENSSAFVNIPPHNHYFKRLSGLLGDSVIDIQNNISKVLNQ